MDLKPALSKSLACSKDLMRVEQTMGVPRGHFVVTFSYPYTVSRYDAVYKLFNTGRVYEETLKKIFREFERCDPVVKVCKNSNRSD